MRPVPVTKMIPNILTLSALIIGTSSLRFALDSRWEMSVYCILIASIIDGLDGKVARMLNASSHFGAELDSLCDFVNFGLCPAVMTYLWSFQQYEYKVFSWSAMMLFIVCMAIRLARFNTVSINQVDKKNKLFLTGVPAPSGALLVLVPMILDFEITTFFENFDVRNYTLFIDCYIIFIALLIASTLPTISVKNIIIKPEYLSFSMIVFAVVIITTVVYPWYVFPLITLLYLLSIPFCIYLTKKL